MKYRLIPDRRDFKIDSSRNKYNVPDGYYMTIRNRIIDALAKCRISGADFRVVLFLIRKTLGFRKLCDRISISQFVKGCSLSKSSIERSLNRVHRKGIARRLKSEKHTSVWTLEQNPFFWKIPHTKRTSEMKTEPSSEKKIFVYSKVKKSISSELKNTKENDKKSSNINSEKRQKGFAGYTGGSLSSPDKKQEKVIQDLIEHYFDLYRTKFACEPDKYTYNVTRKWLRLTVEHYWYVCDNANTNIFAEILTWWMTKKKPSNKLVEYKFPVHFFFEDFHQLIGAYIGRYGDREYYETHIGNL